MVNPIDIRYMKTALLLAKRGVGIVAPNPSVGCVIVKNDQIIASGVTAQGGRPHAETIALAKADARNATLYVTLEPCCHHGKTPPCVDAIIKSGVCRVVIATTDPHSKVAGGGIKALQNHGIEVIVGVCEEEAQELNAGFFSVQLKGMPYIILKLATSADGKIAEKEGVQTQITGKEAQNYAHYLRAINDAVMVGAQTIAVDDPQLTCRLPGLAKQSPIRIVADSNINISGECNLLKTDSQQYPVYILTTKNGEKSNAKIIKCNAGEDGCVDLKDAMQKLAGLGITRLLVEGGSKLAESFLKENLVDELIWIKSPNKIGEKGIPAIDSINIADLMENQTANFMLGKDAVAKKRLLAIEAKKRYKFN